VGGAFFPSFPGSNPIGLRNKDRQRRPRLYIYTLVLLVALAVSVQPQPTAPRARAGGTAHRIALTPPLRPPSSVSSRSRARALSGRLARLQAASARWLARQPGARLSQRRRKAATESGLWVYMPISRPKTEQPRMQCGGGERTALQMLATFASESATQKFNKMIILCNAYEQ
jgi:hypothetical protein